MTRHFEEEMEKIRERQQNKKVILEEAKDALTKIIAEFKKHEREIGKELLEAERETRDEINYIGKCPACKEGDLQLRRGKFGMFIACNKYPECKTTFKLPSNALIKPSKNTCKTCNMPMVFAIKRGKRPREFCINPKCKSKYVSGDAGKEAKEIAKGIIEKECPQCKEGKLVLRKSIYGSFYGCSRFPKCRHTEKLNDGPLKEDFKKNK